MASKKQLETSWDKASKMRGKNPDVWRKDACGNPMKKGSYGTQGQYGWEVDHKNPKKNGGTDCSRNLQALHWQENRQKGAKYPYNG